MSVGAREILATCGCTDECSHNARPVNEMAIATQAISQARLHDMCAFGIRILCDATLASREFFISVPDRSGVKLVEVLQSHILPLIPFVEGQTASQYLVLFLSIFLAAALTSTPTGNADRGCRYWE